MKWLRELLNDPVSRKPSAVRVSALILTLTTVAAVAMRLDWQTIGALCGGGVVALLTRSKGGDA